MKKPIRNEDLLLGDDLSVNDENDIKHESIPCPSRSAFRSVNRKLQTLDSRDEMLANP